MLTSDKSDTQSTLGIRCPYNPKRTFRLALPNPAGTWRLYNVTFTSTLRHEQRIINVDATS